MDAVEEVVIMKEMYEDPEVELVLAITKGRHV